MDIDPPLRQMQLLEGFGWESVVLLGFEKMDLEAVQGWQQGHELEKHCDNPGKK